MKEWSEHKEAAISNSAPLKAPLMTSCWALSMIFLYFLIISDLIGGKTRD